MNPVRLLIFSPIPEEGASARFRVYQYLPALEQDGFEVTVSPFCTPELFSILYDRGHVARKLALGLRREAVLLELVQFERRRLRVILALPVELSCQLSCT